MAEGEQVIRGAPPASSVVMGFVRSSVGAKVLMGLTGLALWGFVIAHLVGNLQIYQGPEAINGYGVFLRDVGHGAFVWLMRALLALAFVVHIGTGVRLAALNRAARPVAYRQRKNVATNITATTMLGSGALLFLFIAFHLSHTTWGLVLPDFFTTTTLKDGREAHDIFSMMHRGFHEPWLVVVYLAGQIVLLSHLIHGTRSLWQSLGIHHGVWSPVLSILGRSIAALIVVLNVSMPIYLYWMPL